MTDARPDPPSVPVDPEDVVAAFIESLERWKSDVLAFRVIPPVDEAVLEAARAEALAVAERVGLGPALKRAQRTMADWVLRRYQRGGYGAVYFSGWQDDADRRLEVVGVLVDAVTGYALTELLSDETAATLVARFDISYGGPDLRHRSGGSRAGVR